MPVIAAVVIMLVAALALTLIIGWLGVPLGLIIGGVVGLVFMLRRREPAPTRGRAQREPTGVPRKPDQDVQTANERVGQA
jgi:hypothetical protein